MEGRNGDLGNVFGPQTPAEMERIFEPSERLIPGCPRTGSADPVEKKRDRRRIGY